MCDRSNGVGVELDLATVEGYGQVHVLNVAMVTKSALVSLGILLMTYLDLGQFHDFLD